MDIQLRNRTTSPDVGVFIYSGIKSDKYCRKYFDDLKSSSFKRGILLETVQKRLIRWLLKLTPTISSFFKYCSSHNLNPKVYLKHIRSGSDMDWHMKDFSRYSNVIEKMLSCGMNVSNLFEVYSELKNHFDAQIYIFSRHPNQIVFGKTDKEYVSKIFEELKEVTGNRFDDREDAEHIALLNYFIHEMSNYEPVFFITMDKVLQGFSEDIVKWNKWIYIVSSKEFYEGLPEFIKLAK